MHSRLNITLSDSLREALGKLARRDRIPQATKAVRLLETAIELEEDQIWNELAQKRDIRNTRYLSHRKAWK